MQHDPSLIGLDIRTVVRGFWRASDELLTSGQ